MINSYMHVVAGGGGGGLAFSPVGAIYISSGNVSSYSTPSVSPSSNELILVAVANSKGTLADIPTLSGLGLTWVQVATETHDATLKRITIFRGRGTVTPGALTASFGVNQAGCYILPVQWSGADVAAPVVQAVTASATNTATASVTMAALGTGNAVWAVSANRLAPYGGTVEGGWTANNNAANTAPNHGLRDIYQIPATDATPSIAIGSTDNWAMIAVEIKQA